MGHFYFHDGLRLLGAGHCPDGMEGLQTGPPGSVMVLGEPPCNPASLGPDDEWSMLLGKVVKRAMSTDELWLRVRNERDARLAATDWRVIKAQESGQSLDAVWIAYRQALRDITNQADPLSINWPQQPESAAVL